jgi:Icc-related predicted phosphoesterase
MKLAIISDTHSYHRRINVPDADVMISCGDFSWRGELDILEDFAQWMGEHPHKKKIVVLGNHDTFENRNQDLPKLVFEKHGVILLHNSGIEVDGLLFYGSPNTPRFGNWAWMSPRHEMGLVWSRIPNHVDVLITHGPPMNILDANPSGFHCGCEKLAERVKDLPQLKVHCFGHIHDSYGILEQNGVKFVNAASCDEHYDPVNEPIVIEV